LWRSDGTPGNAELVHDILAGTGNSFPRRLRDVGSALYFTADDADGWQLWKTDGSDAGTLRVTAISEPGRFPGGDPGGVVCPERALLQSSLNCTLYFTANDAEVGRTLWRTDGTPGNTSLVTDANMEKVARPAEVVSLKRSLFFSAPDGEPDASLW